MRFRSAAVAALRGLALAVFSLAGSIVLIVLTVVSGVLMVTGVGAFTTPWVLQGVRWFANVRRALAAEWCGVRIPAAYRPFPADLRTGATGQIEKLGHLGKDPATWRDLRWLCVDMTAGFLTALLPAAFFLYPVEGYAIALGLWRVLPDAGIYWYGFVHLTGPLSALAAALLGTVLLAIALRFNPLLLRAHFLLTRALLAPAERDLRQRVDELTRTRHDAVDTSAAELRRIERDLHDGAQARLVAVGMSLGTVEALMEKDPVRAKELLARARSDSADALAELRDLVRGIHPPVLAERGLADAVRALALRMPVRVEVAVDLPGRPPASVETAAYFAISETLTNAVKHSGAERIRLDVGHRDRVLRISVTDDGRGGADPRGSGLTGIERRLGTFDGVLAISSPAGGPTLVTMEIPCALSSPKTSSSSGTA
ncbi:sensor domain-containing protein [Streptomyces sp. NPDC002057]|uniref:sensor histidine kinase n=1 Tax=Streptomyces sp. NPDC002057 TaxID=3154664 RepID=UPI0033288422